MLEMRTPENTLLSEVKSWFQIVTDYFRVDPRIFPPEDQKFTAIYSRDKEYLCVTNLNRGEIGQVN